MTLGTELGPLGALEIAPGVSEDEKRRNMATFNEQAWLVEIRAIVREATPEVMVWLRELIASDAPP